MAEPIDVLGAVYDFMAQYFQQIPHVIRGWQNRSALPDATTFAVLTLLQASRQGTNARSWLPVGDSVNETIEMLTLLDVQVDICGEDEATVSRNARELVLLGRDRVAVDFFAPYGLCALYADDARPIPTVDETNEWEIRYSVTLHLSTVDRVQFSQAAFKDVVLAVEESVDHAALEGRPCFGLTLAGMPIDAQHLDAARRDAKLPVALVNYYLQWPVELDNPNEQEWQLDALRTTLMAFRERPGLLPCLTWEPMGYDGAGVQHTIALEAVTSGLYDDYISSVAQILNSFGGRHWVRFGHEMNLVEHHWGQVSQAEYRAASAEVYKILYRYVADRLRAAAADVKLVFCPNAESVPNQSWNTPAAFYPGDDYVDILGMDGYDWDPDHSRPFRSVFDRVHEQLLALPQQSRPLAVMETSTAQADKLPWLLAALETSGEWGLEVVSWFQVDKERHWELILPRSAAELAVPLVKPGPLT